MDTHTSITHALADLREKPIDRYGFRRHACFQLASFRESSFDQAELLQIINTTARAAHARAEWIRSKGFEAKITKSTCDVRLIISSPCDAPIPLA